jgi:hypothetical protein
VTQEADGRLRISFYNVTPGEAPLKLRATPGTLSSAPTSVKGKFGERAKQTRDIVYFLQPPETHAFDLYHDYTESKPGTSTYLNIVRAGSAVSNPRARNLDTGEDLKWDITHDTVVFHFAPVRSGESIRLRMYETYTDTARYKVIGGQVLWWNRSFGRPFNAVVLPSGWVLTNSSIPATVSTMPDGRTRLDFVNPRPDEIAVLITAQRRK